MGDTTIQWTQRVWNPVRGCSRVSPGCGDGTPHLEGKGGCYAERQAYRFSGPGMPYEGLVTLGKNGPRWTGKVRLVPETLDQPFRWKKPLRIFVNSMSDLFHEGLSNEEIAAVFGVMAACARHTFQVLTKRPDRMRSWFDWVASDDEEHPDLLVQRRAYAHLKERFPLHKVKGTVLSHPWPLPNVHIGVSVEDQKRADERIPLLLRTPAALRFLSVEPMLEEISIPEVCRKTRGRCWCGVHVSTVDGSEPKRDPWPIQWVIVGGESGPGARPFDVRWAQSIVEQCVSAGIACFVKQLGSNPHDSFRTITCGSEPDDPEPDTRLKLQDRKGGDPSEWPAAIRVREFPEAR